MTDKQPEALIRADELEAIGAESSLARTMAAHTIRLLYKENEALRAALAQPKQEPVAWFMEGTFEDGTPSFTQVRETDPEFYVPLYTTPPQREWVGLTDEEIEDLWGEPVDCMFSGDYNAIRAIEAKLKEKNT